jgi:hypothetical protein
MDSDQKLQRFLSEAELIFGIQKASNFYIDVLVKLSKNRLQRGLPHDLSSQQNPLVFLTGILNNNWTPKIDPPPDQDIAETPSLNLLIGEYGLGKTELVLQSCNYLCKIPGHQVKALPINLALCHKKILALEKVPSFDDFCELLFGNLLERNGFDKNFLVQNLIPRIHRGEIYLILDGLDELISELDYAPAQHKQFFAGLVRMLEPNPKIPGSNNPKFRVLISMRLEYLWVVTNIEATDLVLEIKDKLPIPVNFLQLEFLTDTSIEEYLKDRTSKDLLRSIQENPLLLDILRRPLYLRVFSDLINSLINHQDSSLEDLHKLLRVEYRAELFELFVNMVSTGSSNLLGKFDNLLSYEWDIDRLSRKALQLYQASEDQLDIDELQDFLKPSYSEEELAPSNIRAAKLYFIHKCPFLQRISETKFSFAHRAFLEFFIAMGIAKVYEDGNSTPFDEIVANVDMRKFLKYFMKKYTEKEYDILSRESNGMNSEAGWAIQNFKIESKYWFLLEGYRVALLDSMIYPETTSPAKIEKIIYGFFKEEDKGLHPSYLKYNYEAIAVNLQYNWWNPKYQQISEEFSKLLYNRTKQLLKLILESDNLDELDLKLNLLLVERILDISRRLRYGWVLQFTDRISFYCRDRLGRHELENFTSQNDEIEIISRISKVIKQVNHSNFISS